VNKRTREYLTGRFRDHYRRTELSLPPAADDREWGYIPWTEGPGTTMVRHRSLLSLGDLGEFLVGEAPRHVYFSAARYDDPGARSMDEKGWRGSDLVFDLDADHLPSVDPEDDYAEMLAACKDALGRLLDLLTEDFGFEDLTVVFSGGRGYHVHVRDPGVAGLSSPARREVVDYVRGEVEFDDLVRTETVAGAGRSTPAEKRTLPTEGGWGGRVQAELATFVEELLAADEETATERLLAVDGVGEKRAAAALRAVRNNPDAVAAGNVDVHPAFLTVARQVAADAVDRQSAPIDEPVTTDVRRLIRAPGSLHGGSGLTVERIDRDALDSFDPLRDAVPETFVGSEVRVDVATSPGAGPGDAAAVSLRGDSFTIEEGPQLLPEYVGVFLMARGRAEKVQE
jgi:DNA primase small subunit